MLFVLYLLFNLKEFIYNKKYEEQLQINIVKNKKNKLEEWSERKTKSPDKSIRPVERNKLSIS